MSSRDSLPILGYNGGLHRCNVPHQDLLVQLSVYSMFDASSLS
jgi:hypothetical protein